MRVRNWRLGGVTLLGICVLLVSSGCNKLKARDELNKGVAFYKAAKYPLAVERFKEAVELDPTLVNARLYLATAYANQYVPGSQSDENLKVGEQAIAEFQKVLEVDPSSLGSISGIASLYFQMKRMDEAKEFYKKQIALDSSNPEPYYSVGVIDWTQTYQPRMVLRTRLKLKTEDPIKDPKERQALAERNLPLIEEGMEMLNRAMQLREDYDDAMAYLNLLYREKADLEETPQAREEALKTADMWMDKSLALKKQKAVEAAKSPQAGS
ncbi:MAG: tetratricopeptide repeat protein [Acidobacteria bacterium]|nr:tetratricopeptide repeat protein [Acidobacteriota bacterium]